MCIDYRALNDITIKDAYQIPNAEDCMNRLGQSKVFSVMDLAELPLAIKKMVLMH